MSELILLIGPSSVGKTPLVEAAKKRQPGKFKEIQTIKSWESRPNHQLRPNDDKKDFRPAATIRGWQNDQKHLVWESRSFPFAIDIEEICQAEKNNPEVLIAQVSFVTLGALSMNAFFKDKKITSLFISPLSQREILTLQKENVDLSEHIVKLMIQKQLARSFYFKQASQIKLIENFIDDFVVRAYAAYEKMTNAHACAGILVNHDGEGHPNWWRESEPQGDAARLVENFLNLINGKEVKDLEKWPATLFTYNNTYPHNRDDLFS